MQNYENRSQESAEVVPFNRAKIQITEEKNSQEQELSWDDLDFSQEEWFAALDAVANC